eukprot:COSAG06_NODE_6733_length_2803_cov_19.880547_5_plen_70_part_00
MNGDKIDKKFCAADPAVRVDNAATSAKPKLRHAKVTPQLADGAQGIWISYLAAHPRGHWAEHRQQIRPG